MSSNHSGVDDRDREGFETGGYHESVLSRIGASIMAAFGVAGPGYSPLGQTGKPGLFAQDKNTAAVAAASAQDHDLLMMIHEHYLHSKQVSGSHH